MPRSKKWKGAAHDEAEARKTLARAIAKMDDDTFDRGCTGKRRYTSKADARGHLAGMRHAIRNGTQRPDPDKSRPLGVYRCKGCGGWHIGHRRRA